jgi:hypothetical protein
MRVTCLSLTTISAPQAQGDGIPGFCAPSSRLHGRSPLRHTRTLRRLRLHRVSGRVSGPKQPTTYIHEVNEEHTHIFTRVTITRDEWECACARRLSSDPPSTAQGGTAEVAPSVRSPGRCRWLRLGPGRLTNTMSPISNERAFQRPWLVPPSLGPWPYRVNFRW